MLKTATYSFVAYKPRMPYNITRPWKWFPITDFKKHTLQYVIFPGLFEGCENP